MTVSCKTYEGTLFIYLSGELDEHCAKLARSKTDRLIDANTTCSKVILNLAGVRFMDSTGIGFLIGRYKRAKNLAMQICIEGPDPATDKVLSLSGIYSLIPRL